MPVLLALSFASLYISSSLSLWLAFLFSSFCPTALSLSVFIWVAQLPQDIWLPAANSNKEEEEEVLLGRLKQLGFLGYGKEGRELQGDLRGVRDLGTTLKWDVSLRIFYWGVGSKTGYLPQDTCSPLMLSVILSRDGGLSGLLEHANLSPIPTPPILLL